MQVSTVINVYEKNGSEKLPNDKPVYPETTIIVKSHWADKRKVVILINGDLYTVSADDITKAIQNACNQ